jgi:hypothetical protein
MSLLITTFAIVFMVAESYIRTQRRNAVKGSHQRYVYASLRIIFNYLVIAFSFACAVMAVMDGRVVSIITGSLVCVLAVAEEVWEHMNGDDDSWFTGRWTKIKNGMKNLASSTQLQPAAMPG